MARTNMNLPDNIDREMRHEAVDLGLRYPGEFVQHLWKQYKKYKEVEKMKKVFEVYNGESRDITIVTDYETKVIPAKSSAPVSMDAEAQFNTDEFYVQEEGNWYAKTESCATGADMEIYDADAE